MASEQQDGVVVVDAAAGAAAVAAYCLGQASGRAGTWSSEGQENGNRLYCCLLLRCFKWRLSLASNGAHCSYGTIVVERRIKLLVCLSLSALPPVPIGGGGGTIIIK